MKLTIRTVAAFDIVRIATLAPDGVRRVHYRKLIKR